MFLHLFLCLLLASPLGTRAVDRSQIPSDKERAYLCDEILVLHRQGYFTPVASGQPSKSHCVHIPPVLQPNVLAYLRDALRRNARPKRNAPYAFGVDYETIGERVNRQRKWFQCHDRHYGKCDEQFGDSGQNNLQMCFAFYQPQHALDSILKTLQCKYKV